jgi:hypothetical protein
MSMKRDKEKKERVVELLFIIIIINDDVGVLYCMSGSKIILQFYNFTYDDGIMKHVIDS